MDNAKFLSSASAGIFCNVVLGLLVHTQVELFLWVSWEVDSLPYDHPLYLTYESSTEINVIISNPPYDGLGKSSVPLTQLNDTNGMKEKSLEYQ